MEEKPVMTGKKEKGRVRFNSTAGGESPNLSSLDTSLGPSPAASRGPSPSITPPGDDEHAPTTPIRRPRPSIIRGSSYNSVLDFNSSGEPVDPTKLQSAAAAHQRAQQVAATMLGSYSAPGSRRGSLDSDITSQYGSGNGLLSPGLPMGSMEKGLIEEPDVEADLALERRNHNSAAYELIRAHTQAAIANLGGTPATTEPTQMPGNLDNLINFDEDEALLGPGGRPREGVLTNLLKLYRVDEIPRKDYSGYTTPGSSGTATPTRRKWYDQNGSTSTLASLAAASAILANPNEKRHHNPARPKHKKTPSGKIRSMMSNRPRMEEEARITIHVANILKRQEFIIKLCKALMMYGAPTHRLEEYLRMMARFLEIDGQFLYLPGCMIISFDDMSTHTTEVKIIRSQQGVNLGKLKDAHEIYKEVLHAVVEVDEAIARLDELLKAKDKFNPWLRVLMYGFASATVAPFAFSARPIDMPICFLLGSFLGFLQLIVAPKSDVYNNVFEIGAAVVTSFLARAFGSIRGGELFCFSAIAQSSICLILPGYLVLCAALELQSRAIVPGSIRMVYAIIYSLFLGFGITIGTAIYGWIDENATSSTSCSNTIDTHWNFLFVPAFAFCLTYVNQAKWKQMPVMIVIAMVGYVVNYFLTQKFPNSSQICNTIGALAVGICANLYSRVRHGVAAAALLPAIFVQVPSGLAATGSLLSGLSSANELTNSTSSINGTTTVQVSGDSSLDTIVFNVAASMIEIAVGITVGLFFATLIVYPLGKRRSGLFTF
ncbi:putative Threonine/serine exporter-like N-terminal domain-containing protein [Seiridium cardinale]|uniref:Threonine/serine exporter-like N-terminal domain-containing protein n=1 Tax=Seiridium cardinale TaxID=138064 RepID=A0ABR2X5R2_9PEZI